MDLNLLIFIFLGLIFGSFNTMLIHRLPLEMDIVFTRSACPKCRKLLSAFDLIPLFSWLINAGKCRHCHNKVAVRYPLTELATCALFSLSYQLHGASFNALLIALLGSHLLVLFIIDIEHRIIPDLLQIIVTVLGLIYAVNNNYHLSEIIAGALLGGGIGLILQFLVRAIKKIDGLGMGDVKFMAASGVWLGTDLISYYFYAGIIGVVSAILWRIKNDDPRFPFGPALAISLFMLVIYPPSKDWQTQLSIKIVTMLGII
jgi:prepilin signal peptidase PulO-like enzyme (type II secretory pathway)